MAEESIEPKNITRQSIIEKLRETKAVVTHFGDDLDNKSSTYALDVFAREQGILKEGEHLQILRVPAGQIKERICKC